MPQSNQRGIETRRMWGFGSMKKCLNRTSVGLKHPPTTLEPSNPIAPQSNQRGIETNLTNYKEVCDDDASIEPAWD